MASEKMIALYNVWGGGTLLSVKDSMHQKCPIAIIVCLGFLSCLNLAAAAQLPGRWQLRASVPEPRSELAAVELNGKIYLIGGYIKNGDLFEEYDPASDSWRRRASLPKSLHHIGAASINGKIYVIGGYITGIGPVATVYEY
ncbi:MAG TPA: kelch repeat-containing protein, partial [Candidatus Binatia bacterium]|nr:kelch repeat-containing protein [Candidatus Binatia bacterium]